MNGQPQTVEVFLTNAVQTSAGPGPGTSQPPQPETATLIRGKLAVCGAQPPRGFPAVRDEPAEPREASPGGPPGREAAGEAAQAAGPA